jgi:hypothetical protein
VRPADSSDLNKTTRRCSLGPQRLERRSRPHEFGNFQPRENGRYPPYTRTLTPTCPPQPYLPGFHLSRTDVQSILQLFSSFCSVTIVFESARRPGTHAPKGLVVLAMVHHFACRSLVSGCSAVWKTCHRSLTTLRSQALESMVLLLILKREYMCYPTLFAAACHLSLQVYRLSGTGIIQTRVFISIQSFVGRMGSTAQNSLLP